MPTFEITTPKGRFQVTAPDEKSAVDAMNSELRAIDLADKQEKVMGKAGAGELYQNQFMFGAGDKVAGAANVVSGMMRGDFDFGQNFETGRRAQEIREQRARDATGSLGTLAEIGGAVTTGAVAKAPAAATALGRVGQAAKEGGTLGAYFGLGDTDARTLQGAAGDTAVGAVFGAGAGGAMSGLVEGGRAGIKLVRGTGRALANAAQEPAPRAAAKVAGALADDSVSPELATARMANRGTSLMNVGGENTMGLARQTNIQPGASRSIMTKALNEQQRQSFSRAMNIVDETMGGGDVPFNQRVATMMADKSAKAKHMYDMAYRQEVPTSLYGDLRDIVQKLPRSTFAKAREIAHIKGRPFLDEEFAGPVVPTVEESHYLLRALRDMKNSAFRNGDGEVGAELSALYNRFRSTLFKIKPFADAQKSYADDIALGKALAAGRDILKPGTTNNVDAVLMDLADMSAAEKEMFRIGAARGVQDAIRRTPSEAGNLIKNILGTPAKRDALKAAFGDSTEFRKFEADLMRIGKETQLFRDASTRTNSRTGVIAAENDAFNNIAEAASVAGEAMHGGSGILYGLTRMLRSQKGMDPKVAEEVAKILVNKNPQEVAQILAAPMRQTARQAALDALLHKVRAGATTAAVGLAGPVGMNTYESDMIQKIIRP